MFYECVNLTTIPPLDTSKVTDMDSMFYSCSSLQSIPEIDTSNVTTMNYMFFNCTDLVSLPKFNVNNCTNMSRLFFYGTNTKLKDVGGWENLKCNWNDNYGLKSLSNLTYQSCINIINGLYDFVGNEETPTSTQGQLKVHSNFITTATEEQIAVATAKGWTLTT
jgi:surface protein